MTRARLACLAISCKDTMTAMPNTTDDGKGLLLGAALEKTPCIFTHKATAIGGPLEYTGPLQNTLGTCYLHERKNTVAGCSRHQKHSQTYQQSINITTSHRRKQAHTSKPTPL